MVDRLYATDHFTDLYFNCRIYDSWQVLNFTYFCFSLLTDIPQTTLYFE
ncbi:hypothetical protein AI2694V1_1073 [Enterobacter cloacae]|nr:hypothetical protein AI2694V1_1073 [Enterobacter cloacae]SAG02153.1 Uncharacterised protein [Enterobacter asburiae]CAE7466789.1 hypothetical protein AI2674V1_1073 [Enterobacter cloacae]CAE7491215.1 hypothetical protein AI2679V1_1073 [Enterobacter cloacae]CAH3557811.1 hypothetical protein AI2679V1_1073 [Enterobacter cloacae]